MGDVLSGIFGGGESTGQQVATDPATTAMRQMKLQQMQEMAGNNNFASFGRPAFEQYTPTAQSQQMTNAGMAPLLQGQVAPNEQLQRALTGNTGALGSSLGTTNQSLQQAIAGSQGTVNQGLQGLQDRMQASIAGNQGYLNAGLQNATANMQQGLEGNQNWANTGLQTLEQQMAGQQNALGQQTTGAIDAQTRLGLDQTSNYINQVATPQIMQAMALQGLEQGGAAPAAIARATAEYGMPIIQQIAALQQQGLSGQQALGQQGLQGTQSLLGAGMQNAAALYGQNQALQGALQGQALQGANALQGQGLGAAASLYNQGLGTQGSLYGQGMQGQSGLLQNYLSGNQSIYGQFPAAQAMYQTAPAQAVSTLFPMTDQLRALGEQDLMRRQNLASTTYTGIPTTAGTSTQQSRSSQPLFNFFGQA
jgi:hypothetical protein